MADLIWGREKEAKSMPHLIVRLFFSSRSKSAISGGGVGEKGKKEKKKRLFSVEEVVGSGGTTRSTIVSVEEVEE